jgi:NAD(P)-dependent dehydrogenase (short-subunit alcohol dehydrogenase family)
MSKFAVVGMTESMAVEGRELGIRVNCVAPGAVDTEMLRKAAPHLKTETMPADVAEVIYSLCDDVRSACVTGATLPIHSNL